MADYKLPRLQFSLRWLFVIVAASAVCALVYRVTGAVETAGVAVSFLLCGLCLNLPMFRFRRSLRCALLAMATIIVWLVGVDYSRFQDRCVHCNSHWDVEEVRIFHQPVWSRTGKDHQPTLRLIAEDLGAPCLHDYQRWQYQRAWGFVLPGPPWVCGTCCISGGDWYVGEDRDYVRSLGARDPKVGEEFQSALLKHDYQTVRRLVSEVRPPAATDAASK